MDQIDVLLLSFFFWWLVVAVTIRLISPFWATIKAWLYGGFVWRLQAKASLFISKIFKSKET